MEVQASATPVNLVVEAVQRDSATGLANRPEASTPCSVPTPAYDGGITLITETLLDRKLAT